MWLSIHWTMTEPEPRYSLPLKRNRYIQVQLQLEPSSADAMITAPSLPRLPVEDEKRKKEKHPSTFFFLHPPTTVTDLTRTQKIRLPENRRHRFRFQSSSVPKLSERSGPVTTTFYVPLIGTFLSSSPTDAFFLLRSPLGRT